MTQDGPIGTRPPRAPNAVSRPSGRDVGLMAIGVLAISTSAPLIAATAAPALSIAFWRNALATLVIGPFALLRHRAELVATTPRERWLTLASGGLLTLHFATWVPSIRLTSVASAAALVATQPVWSALMARATGHHVPRTAWLGMAIAFAGVLVLTGIDLRLSTRALVGDLMALAGAVFAAAYVTVGAVVRRTVSTTTYTFGCYGTCSVLLVVLCLVLHQPLTGYDGSTWAKIVALTAGAQLLGHSVFNLVLQTTSPTVVSLAILFEMPGAALIAAAWLGQLPPAGVVPAALLLLVGVAVVVRSGGASQDGPLEPAPQ